MEPTEPIARYRRFLKRRNYSVHTVKNYVNILGHFSAWLQIPIERVTSKETDAYMDHLLRRRKKPKTINCHFGCIHAFYDYLIEDEGMPLANPVKKNYRLRLPRPLPKHLRDAQVEALFNEINDTRDRAMFMLMLRCGLRVEEVARLTADAIEYRSRQLYVFNGKGSKDRVVYLSEDALSALEDVYAEAEMVEGEKSVLSAEGTAEREADISSWHSKENRTLCTEGRDRGILSSLETHYGNPAVKCGCRSRYHSGSAGPQPDYYNPVLL